MYSLECLDGQHITWITLMIRIIHAFSVPCSQLVRRSSNRGYRRPPPACRTRGVPRPLPRPPHPLAAACRPRRIITTTSCRRRPPGRGRFRRRLRRRHQCTEAAVERRPHTTAAAAAAAAAAGAVRSTKTCRQRSGPTCSRRPR